MKCHRVQRDRERRDREEQRERERRRRQERRERPCSGRRWKWPARRPGSRRRTAPGRPGIQRGQFLTLDNRRSVVCLVVNICASPNKRFINVYFRRLKLSGGGRRDCHADGGDGQLKCIRPVLRDLAHLWGAAGARVSASQRLGVSASLRMTPPHCGRLSVSASRRLSLSLSLPLPRFL